MELYATRPEMRRRLLAAMGFATSDADSAMLTDTLNEMIRDAMVEVATGAWWARRRREARATLGIDQRFMNLPAGAGIGDLIEVGVWDDTVDRYVSLEHKTIRVSQHTDPLDDVGGAEDEATRAMPRQWCYFGSQIEVWPESEIARDCKFIYNGAPAPLTEDVATSDVDADLVHRKAMALYYLNRDPAISDRWELRYRDRWRELNHWAHTCETVSLDPMARFSGQRADVQVGSRYDLATAIANRS
jgi:hypothetical protein